MPILSLLSLGCHCHFLTGLLMTVPESSSTLKLHFHKPQILYCSALPPTPLHSKFQWPYIPLLFKKCIYFSWKLITWQYCSDFCHTLIWISHMFKCVPHPEPPSHIPPHPIPQGHPSASALITPSHALNLDWQSVSYMIIYMFHCYSFRSSHPRLLPQSPKDCFIHLCLFCCLTYRVIITIFLNSTYMH